MTGCLAEIALITGCGSGIGRALAQNLHKRVQKNGSPAYRVFATDYRIDLLKGLEEDGLEVLQLDVTDAESIKAAVESVLSKAGRIDLLVCNAGIYLYGWVVELDYDEVRRLFDVNYFGTFRVIQAVAPQMMDRRSGKIATLCSVNSYGTNPCAGAYCSSKAAIAMMTESLRMEVEPFGVSVTSVVPGFVKTDIINRAVSRFDWKPASSFYMGLIDRIWRSRTMLGEKGTTAEQAAADIAAALAQPKPPRFVRTGAQTRLALLAGFLQTWGFSWLTSGYFKQLFGLDQPHLLGRHVSNPLLEPEAGQAPTRKSD